MISKKRLSNLIIIFVIILALIGFDQLTKALAVNNATLLRGEKIIVIPHIISFRLAYNTGAAWSLLEGKKIFLCLISLLAGIAIGFYIVKKADLKNNLFATIALIMIEAGCFGNLIDRAFYKKGVIDFLCFEFIDFPIFNVADSLLTVGTILFALYILFIYKEDANKATKSLEGEQDVKD